MKVLRQVYESGRWVTLGAALTDANGRLTFVVTPTTRGRTYAYRVYAYGTSSVLPMSKGFTIRRDLTRRQVEADLGELEPAQVLEVVADARRRRRRRRARAATP